MKLIHYRDVSPTRFDNEKAKGVDGRVLIGQADGAPFCMRVFEIEAGGHTPFHTHNWEHEMFFHRGRGQMYCQGGWTDVSAGTVVLVSAGEEHQIRNTGKETLTLICLVPKGAPEL